MMRLCTLLLIIPLAGLCMTAPTQAQANGSPARTLKILPISDLLARARPVRSPRFGVLSSTLWAEDRTNLLGHGKPFGPINSDALLELIRRGVGDEVDDMSLMVKNHTLIVSGDAGNVAKTEGVVAALRQALTQRIAVHARLYRIRATDEFPATADASTIAELVKNLPLLWKAHSTALSGQQVAMSQERFTSYIGDVDIEVAEEAKIGDPKTTTMFEGIRLVVEPHALIGTTDRVVKCQFAIGEKERDTEDVSTGVKSLSHIGIPHLRASSGAFSGRVKSDGALLLSLQSRGDSGSNLLLVVQTGKVGSPVGNEVSAGRTLLLPVSGMAGGSLRADSSLKFESEGDRGGYPNLEEYEEAEDLGEMLVNLLRESIGDELDNGDASIDLTDNGHSSGFILVHGSEKIRTQARSLLITLQDHWLRTTEIKLRTTLEPAPATTTTFSELSPTTNQPGPTYHALTFPSLHGHTALIMKGVESAVIQDFDVEIASKSTLANPVVHPTFSGLMVVFRGAQQGRDYGGTLAVDLQYLSEPRRQPTGQNDGGDLHHTRVHRARFSHNGRISFDQSIPMGFGPRLRDEQKGLRMHQTMRFRQL